MGIELPPELADVAAATGLTWPQADEDKLRAQAGAWRDAQRKLTTLAGEADQSVTGALAALTGPSADAASRKWAGYVHPDTGHLTASVTGAGEAADRLDHAAEQVGQAKVEMVRQLIDAAKNRDAAQTAASAGHPTALLGLDSVLHGTATNLSSLTHGLAGAVGPDGGGPVSSLANVVDPNPGAHTQQGQGGLLSTVTGLPGDALSTVDSTLGAPGDSLLAGGRAGDELLGAGAPGDSLLGHGSLGDSLAGSLRTGPLGDALLPGQPGGDQLLPGQPAGDALLAGQPLGDALLPGQSAGDALLPGQQPANQLLPGQSAGDQPLPGQPLGDRPLPGQPAADQPFPGQSPPGQPPPPASPLPVPTPPLPAHPIPSVVDTPDAGTGPIQVPQPPAHYGGFLQSGGFDDVPTPATGTPQFRGGTVASGFTDAAYSPPPPAPAAPPPIAPPAPAAQPAYVAPPQYPSAAPPPVAAPPTALPAAGFASRQAPVPSPAAGPAVPAPAPAGGAAPRPAPVAGPLPGAASPAARQAAPAAAGYGPRPPVGNSPYAPQPYPQRPAEAPLPPLGAPRQERESVVALFLVHMFPLGHLPVAADRPARQLPVPPPDMDYAPGLRFPPHDHPRSDLIDSADALERITAGYSRLPTPPGEPPAALLAGHDPLGGLQERDWDRRFLAGMRENVPEYAWPPGERYPEGGHEPGEPELLGEGTLLDRFGPIGGRIFAPDGTAFLQRSLPPAALDAGYRRYRVLREVPMWQAVSAPWFGQPGGGVRYRGVYSADELVTMGYLEDVTFEEAE